MARVATINTWPQDIRDQLNQKLLASGFGNLTGMVAWLAEQGYEINRTSLGDYSKSIKDQMTEAARRGRERVEVAKLLKGLDDKEKSLLLEVTEMTAIDQLMDMYEAMSDMTIEERMAYLPKLIQAQTQLSRSAVGSAKWRTDFEATIRAEERQQAAQLAADVATVKGLSPEFAQFLRQQVLQGGV